MSWVKKYIIAVTLVVAVFACAMYLLATDDIMLLNPKTIVSSYQACQNYFQYIYPNRDDGATYYLTLDSVHIEDNNGYDYYLESFCDGPDYKSNYLVKKKGDEIISAFDMQKLELSLKHNYISVKCGVFSNGYLYFTIENTNSIFRTDDNLENCVEIFTPKKFGRLQPYSFFIKDNAFYYLTDSRKLVKYDGAKETQIKELPELDSMNLIDKTYRDYLMKFMVPVNSINDVFYYGVDNNLFYFDDGGNTVCIDLRVSKHASHNSGVYRIEPCEKNDKLMSVSYLYEDFNPEMNYYYMNYLINPKTGHYIKFKQSVNNRNHEVTTKELFDYDDSLSLKAGTEKETVVD